MEKSKYFICKNEYEAKAMRYISEERYYKFDDDNGNTKYVFKKNKKVFEAYKMLMDAKNKLKGSFDGDNKGKGKRYNKI